MAEGLRACGWTVHRIGDVFPDDGQDIPDEEWITYGLDRSWVPLSKDGRIKTRDLEIRQLRSAEMVERPVVCRDVIHRAVEKGGPAAYAVRHDRIERTWP
ncbi:toxin-antitoxin system, toxin component, PIN family protein [Streptomyces sp. NPDC005209]|uniref:PIN-like domain-containing protein n=1 Tax=Streptomyces sp. NPDC005209 TaxID=3156715 RepID=UPI0033B2423B